MQYSGRAADYPGSHESVTRAGIAARLARLLGYDDGGEYDPACRYPGRLYFVPGDTLVDESARALGIRGEQDLFGGVVPCPFLATKAVAHPLVEGGFAPPGWLHAFGSRVTSVVLYGYTAFTQDDARRAGRRVLATGDARVKPGQGIGGRGQEVVSNTAELDAALDALDAASLLRDGVVIEQDLKEVTTYSVGRLRVGDFLASYVGTQRLTPDNGGAQVYGGSDLVVVRGDYDALPGPGLAPAFLAAVERARAFDSEVSRAYPGLIASRRNYDIAQGLDASGKPRIGLLEQSWRIGGASPAEIAALEAFQKNPHLRAVQACCVELYGNAATVPPGATTYFCRADARVGRITKYAFVRDHGSPA